MTLPIDTYINEVVKKEGGYVNNKKDSGGPTKYGITQKVANDNGFSGSIESLTLENATTIYKLMYWYKPKFDMLQLIDPELTQMLFQFGVLAGVNTASKMVQRAMNVLNNKQFEWSDLKVDGILGIDSQQAIKIFYRKRGADGRKVLLGMVAALQSVYLIECAEKNKNNEEFEYGWQLNRVIGRYL